MNSDRSTPSADAKSIAVRSIELVAAGSREDFDAIIHPDAVNHETKTEPPHTRVRGPGSWHATALWLRRPFADLHFEIRNVVADGDLVAVEVTMSGRHVGLFLNFDDAGAVAGAFPPTGRSFAVTQSHWVRLEDGLVIEHWANRDDLGMAEQLGWLQPSPAYLARMLWAKRRARKSPPA
ncbi:ester cyclase [Rhodococcus oryzae]|uniref:Ester cyclase n=1 Tax=Rhodococcus oryzae TaxID=2571143 RepID=A0ABY2RJ50_9NOCA|nr:ester cyclase [Rhodococcus oryzae]TJZ77046.1 ester cyclase [Rhodococcus oryzae]